MMKDSPEVARSIALHAGQIIHLATHSPSRSTPEPSSFFYATVCLYLFAKSLARCAVPLSHIASTLQLVLKLDEPLEQQSDAVGFVVGGGECTVGGIGLLSQEGAGARVLERLGEVLEGVGTTWRLGLMMARALRTMASEELGSEFV